MESVLRKFATNISVDYDTECDRVARTYLAVHVGMVPTQLAYAIVASDYTSLNMRAYNPPLSTYASKCPDIETFVFLAQHSAVVPSKSMAHFVNTVFPEQMSREAWKRAVDKTTDWQNNAYFLALNARGSTKFRDLISSIAQHGDGSEDIATRLIKYKPLSDAHTLATDMGKIIASVKIKPVAAKDEDEVIAIVEAEVSQFQDGYKVDKPASVPLESVRNQMEPYRKRALLPHGVTSMKLAKQMILAALGASLSSTIAVGYQKTLTPIKESDHEVIAAILKTEEFQSLKVNSKESPHCAALAAAIPTSKWNVAKLVGAAIDPASHMDVRALDRYNNRMGGQKGDAELIRAIVAL